MASNENELIGQTTSEVRLEINVDKLISYLAAQVPEHFKNTNVNVRQFNVGQSNPTYLLNTTNGHPNTWTEYTLYWMWLHKEGKMDKYSFEAPYLSWNELFTFNYRKGYGETYFNEFDSLVMNNKEHYFNIVQSNILDVKLDFVVEKLKKHIGE